MSLLLRGYTVTAEQVAEAAEVEVEEDPLDRELDRIRQRRTGQRKFFRGTFDDWTLVVGVISGIVFFGGMMILSSGIIAADSIVLDQTLSKTPIDPGGNVKIRRERFGLEHMATTIISLSNPTMLLHLQQF